MKRADKRFLETFLRFLTSEIGEHPASICMYAVWPPFGCSPDIDIFYACTTSNDVVYGYLLVREKALLPFYTRWHIKERLSKAIARKPNETLLDILQLSSDIMVEPEQKQRAPLIDDGWSLLYLRLGTAEKVSDSTDESERAGIFTREFTERIRQRIPAVTV